MLRLRSTSERCRSSLLCLALGLVVGVTFWLSPVRQVADSYYSMLVSESLLRRGSLDLDPYFVPPLDPRRYPGIVDGGYPYLIAELNGHVYYVWPIGSSLLSVPLVGFMLSQGVSAVDTDGRFEQGGEEALQAFVATVVATATVVVLFLVARLFLPAAWSLTVALGAAFGTQLYSIASRVVWSHTWFILLVSLAILLLARHVTGVGRLRPVLLGTLVAWAYCVRPTATLVFVLVAVYLLWQVRWALPTYLATCAAWLLAFVAHSLAVYDLPLPPYYFLGGYGVGLGGRGNVAVGLAGLLISPSRGLLVFVPVLLFVGYLLARHWATVPQRPLALLALAIVVVHTAQLSRFLFWWGGHTYGPRLLTDLVPWLTLLAVLGLAAWRAAQSGATGRPGQWFRIGQGVGALLLLLSIAIHTRAAWAPETALWSIVPNDIEAHQERLWDWRYPQFLAGLFPPP